MALTPMMQQYFSVKENYKDCIVFFRLGDFYEMFFDDAVMASKEIELALTGRDCGLDERAPMCGIPYHAASGYISKLVSKGHKIAICEQLEDPSQAKGIVRRGVTKVITPGTYTDSEFLDENKNNFLMSVYIKDDFFGLSYADVSTGEFYTTEYKYDINLILDEISKVAPSEILIPEDFYPEALKELESRFSIVITKLNSYFYDEEAAEDFKNRFNEQVANYSKQLFVSSSSLFKYIAHTHKVQLTHITNINFYNVVNYLSIDINSRRNLELTETIMEKSKKGSLLWVLDKTNTVMGSRLLRKWVEQPITDVKEVKNRLSAVEELVNNISLLEDLTENLKGIYDIERIVGKISTKNVNAKELVSLKSSLGKIPKIKQVLTSFHCPYITTLNKDLDDLKDVFELIHKSILEEPSLSVKDGDIINGGYNFEVDELRNAKTHGKEWIAALENREKEETGIKFLKISHNRVFGYYIEVTNSNLSLVPEDRYIRKQTLSNAERYFTEELKSMEGKIFGAIEKLSTLEYDLFTNIRDNIESEIERMKKSATVISKLDCLSSLAIVALENNYCKPEINDCSDVIIEDGRHPVVEKMIPNGSFVSNNITINNHEDQMLLITGPNMAGKSTYMRQIALIVIMTQIGSFVPASYAKISICDKIFTRIGASDDLAAGKSTFMVEMWEVSNILKNATTNSLILLDEVGRGTSTFDGLSIAWAVIEYICTTKKVKCKTLFATHYHELTKLEGVLEGLKNYSIAVKEVGNEIVFLRKIIRGGADDSYGIEVAKLAGIPQVVIERAKEILNKIEDDKANKLDVYSILNKNEPALLSEVVTDVAINENTKKSSNKLNSNSVQLGFGDFEKHLLLEEIATIDVMNMTPMEGFNKLYEIIGKAKKMD